MSKQIVSVAEGNEYQSTLKSLELIRDQIVKKLDQKKPKEIFLKPNWLKYRPDWLPITKLDTLRATVDFFNKLGKYAIIIGDATPTIFGWDGKSFLKQANYKDLEKEYNNVKVIDLNNYPAKKGFLAKTIDGSRLIRYYEPILKAKFLVSIAKIKTHDTFANTLSLKNVAIGCSHWQDKILFHGTVVSNDPRISQLGMKTWYTKVLPMINYNFFYGSKTVYPDAAIIDGVEAMEGDGPSGGTAVHLGITLASTDALSADIVATRIMGFELSEIPYLDILNDVRKPEIQIVGKRVNQFKHNFKLHCTHKYRCFTQKQDVLKLIR